MLKCLAHNRMCEDYHRGRCKSMDLCSYKERKCRKCGCTEKRACVKEGTPCHWVERDLCSACA